MTSTIESARVLYVSRSGPPGVSGSAHVLKELLAVDESEMLVSVSEQRLLRKGDVTSRLIRLRTGLSFFGRGARFFAPIRELLLPLVAWKLTRLASIAGIDRIVCVFPDALYCRAALIASRNSGKPISFYFHNTYAANRKGVAAWRARRVERQLMEQSARLYFISEALQDVFAKRYPEIEAKSEVLHHPVAAADDERIQPQPFRSTPVRATLIGNLNESNIDAANRMVRALGRRPDVHITICTPVPKVLLLARGMNLSNVDYRGYVSDAELQELLEATDLFLLPHGLTGGYSAEEYRTIFPTRAAYYLSYGRAVLAHCPADSGLYRFLKRHEIAVCVTDADEEAVIAAFERLAADPRLQIDLATRAREISRFFAPRSILDRLIASNGQ